MKKNSSNLEFLNSYFKRVVEIAGFLRSSRMLETDSKILE